MSPLADRLVGELSALRILTHLDRAALAAYCGAYALWAEATEAIQKYGAMIKSPQGFPIQSPYLAIANRQGEIMMRIASEFGFTPASRSRIAHQQKLLHLSSTCWKTGRKSLQAEPPDALELHLLEFEASTRRPNVRYWK